MKIFTDTQIWNKPWFRRVTPRVKELFRYLCENCDPAGVIDPDWDLMSFMIGEKVSKEDLESLNGNVIEKDGKLFLPQFVEFQYGKLSKDCPPHAKVFAALERHGIKLTPRVNTRVATRVSTRELEEEEEEEEYKGKKSMRGKGEKKQHAVESEIPKELDDERFKTAWGEWLTYRAEKRKPVSHLAARQQFKKFVEWGIEASVESIKTSIANDWQGVFPPQANGKRSGFVPASKDQMLIDAIG